MSKRKLQKQKLSTDNVRIVAKDMLENEARFRLKVGVPKSAFAKWGKPVVGGIGAGALIGLSTYVYLIMKMGWFASFLISLGIVTAPVAGPVVAAIITGLLSTGVIAGWELYREFMTEEAQKSYHSPKAKLADKCAHWVFLPALGAALVDGTYQRKEQTKLKELMKEWGYCDEYTKKFIHANRRKLGFDGINIYIPTIRQEIKQLVKEHGKDITFEKIKKEIVKTARLVVESKGSTSEAECKFLTKLQKLK